MGNLVTYLQKIQNKRSTESERQASTSESDVSVVNSNPPQQYLPDMPDYSLSIISTSSDNLRTALQSTGKVDLPAIKLKPPKLNLDMGHFKSKKPDSPVQQPETEMRVRAEAVPGWMARLNDTGYIRRLWQDMCDLEQKTTHEMDMSVAQKLQNRRVNRYTDILPFDHNRVPLGGNGYINASFMNSITGQVNIATQGPLANTVLDFWTMVWEQNASLIIMLTKEEEKGRNKCFNYWDNAEDVGDFRIDVASASSSRSTVERKVIILNTKTGELRTIKHLQFITWPDHSTSDPESVLELVYKTHKERNGTTEPMVVHCSAGCGRTATFLTIYSLIVSGNWITEMETDLVAMQVAQFRKDRIGSVQTYEQLVLCYEALLSRLNTQIPQ